jgi:hypothetical protein
LRTQDGESFALEIIRISGAFEEAFPDGGGTKMNWTPPLFTRTCGLILAVAVFNVLGRASGFY